MLYPAWSQSEVLNIRSDIHLSTFFNRKSSKDIEYSCAFSQSERQNLNATSVSKPQIVTARGIENESGEPTE